MIQLRQDSRDKHFFEHFGQVVSFPLEVNFDTPLPDTIQAPGDVECTAITTCELATDETKVVYDFQELFRRIPSNSFGADPRDALGEAVSNGLKRKDYDLTVKSWNSYWRADTGSSGLIDAFDNVRSAMLLAQAPVGVATGWYDNWTTEILPEGNRMTSGHMYAIEGWKQVNDEPMFIIEAWLGRKLLMPRKTFNKALGIGCGSWVLSTAEIDAKRKISFMKKMIDACTNLILALRALLILKKKPEIKMTEIQEVSKYLWDTKENIKHSVRVICDEEGLDLEQKNTMCATIQAESGFNLKAKNLNKNSKGVVTSTDWGLCQWNDKYHSSEITPDESVNNPEKAVRLMCAYWKRGQRDLWIAYKNGSYKKYL